MHLKDPGQHVVTASGEELVILGQADVPISLGTTTVSFPVIVTSTLTQPCLLGADFLQHQGCVIDLQDRTLGIQGETIHMLPPHYECIFSSRLPCDRYR